MRTVAAVLALGLAACTPGARTAPPAPSALPAPPATASPAPPPERLAYVSELAPGARHTLVAAGGRLYLFDDAGRIVSARWIVGGGDAALSSAGGKTYAVVSRENGVERLWTYRDGVLTEAGSGTGWYLGRFASGGRTYRMAGDAVVRDTPRRRWPMPDQPDPWAPPDGKGYRNAEEGRDVLATFTTRHGPVVVSALPGRCEVANPGRGLQTVVDASEPWHWELCAAAAVDTDGTIALLARDSGRYTSGYDRAVLLHVDADTLAVVDRTVLTALPQGLGPGFATLVALPGGLVAYLRNQTGDWVVDLRGDRPVRHRLPTRWLSYATAAAGPDAIFVLGEGGIARVTVSTGRVERDVLRVPSWVTGVVRTR